MGGGGDLYFCCAAAAALIPVTVGPCLSMALRAGCGNLEVNALAWSYAVVLVLAVSFKG